MNDGNLTRRDTDGRRVVLVAPEFPPSNTAGAHRPRLFAKHLPTFGWTPTVLTLRHDCYEGPLDRALEKLVDPQLNVLRTGAFPVSPVRLMGDLGLRSLPYHARALVRVCRRGDVDAVVLFGPPWFSFVLGPLVLRRFGIPYVVDYIDPWVSEWTEEHRFPSKGWFYHRAALALEPLVLRWAAHVSAVSDGILEDLRRRYPWLGSERLSAMPYGAEPDDVDAAGRLGISPPDFAATGETFNVCFTGAIQPRSAELVRTVLGAVSELRSERPALGKRVRLRFYGTSNLTWGHDRPSVLPIAREMGLDDVVTEMPQRIPYLEAMAVLRSADVVLVMGSWEHYYHASKLYPALAAGKPILALCHRESSIARVMADTRAGVCITADTPAEVERQRVEVAAALAALLEGTEMHAVRHAAVEQFSAAASTRTLARMLDAAARRRLT